MLKASTRTIKAAGVAEEADTLVLSMQVVLLPGVGKTHLTVEAYNRGLARAEDLGAKWNGELRSWMVRPNAAADIPAWVPAGAASTHMFPSLVSNCAS